MLQIGFTCHSPRVWCGEVKKHTSGPINGVYDTVAENPLDVAFAVLHFLLNLLCTYFNMKK